MKTKDLIKKLQEADPTGELECCVGNVDIHFIESLPAYYDGCLQVLTRDKAKEPYYSITGGKYFQTGDKVVLHTLAFSDVVFQDEDAVIDFSDLTESRKERYQKNIEDIRRRSKEIHNEVELEHFINWVKKKAGEVTGETDVSFYAKEFYEKNLNYKDPIPGDIPKDQKSYNDRKEIQWDREIIVSFDGFNFEIKKACPIPL